MDENSSSQKETPTWVWIMLALLAFIAWQLYSNNSHGGIYDKKVIIVTPTPFEKSVSREEEIKQSIENQLKRCLDRARYDSEGVKKCYEDYDYSMCEWRAALSVEMGGTYYEGECDPDYGYDSIDLPDIPYEPEYDIPDDFGQ